MILSVVLMIIVVQMINSHMIKKYCDTYVGSAITARINAAKVEMIQSLFSRISSIEQYFEGRINRICADVKILQNERRIDISTGLDGMEDKVGKNYMEQSSVMNKSTKDYRISSSRGGGNGDDGKRKQKNTNPPKATESKKILNNSDNSSVLQYSSLTKSADMKQSSIPQTPVAKRNSQSKNTKHNNIPSGKNNSIHKDRLKESESVEGEGMEIAPSIVDDVKIEDKTRNSSKPTSQGKYRVKKEVLNKLIQDTTPSTPPAPIPPQISSTLPPPVPIHPIPTPNNNIDDSISLFEQAMRAVEGISTLQHQLSTLHRSIHSNQDIIQSTIHRNSAHMEYYIKRIHDKFKQNDSLLKDIVEGIQGGNISIEYVNSKLEHVMSETIIMEGGDGKLRFEDLIDVPSNYEQDSVNSQQDQTYQRILPECYQPILPDQDNSLTRQKGEDGSIMKETDNSTQGKPILQSADPHVNIFPSEDPSLTTIQQHVILILSIGP